jgi:RNA polymerase sigma factor (sigma-70 family)
LPTFHSQTGVGLIDGDSGLGIGFGLTDIPDSSRPGVEANAKPLRFLRHAVAESSPSRRDWAVLSSGTQIGQILRQRVADRRRYGRGPGRFPVGFRFRRQVGLNNVNDDSILLRRYVSENSQEAFAELVRRHLDFVFSVAMRETRGDHARAQDVTQEVFTVLARKALSLQHRATLAGWLHIGVHHATVHLMRSEQRRQRRERDAWAMQDQSQPWATESDWERLRPELNDAVRALGEVDRDILLLRFYQQRPFSEIAVTLRMSADAAQKRAERALEKLRGHLVRRGITSTSAALAFLLGTRAVEAAPAGLAAPIIQGALAPVHGGARILFHLMKLSKTKMAVAAVLLAGVSTVIIRQRLTEAALRHKVATLEAADHLALRLRAGDPAVRSALASMRMARPATDGQSPLASAPTNGPWPSLAPGAKRRISSLHNAGSATPAAALESLIWSKENLDFETLNHLLAFTSDVQAKADALYAEMPKDELDELGLSKSSKLVAYCFGGLAKPYAEIQVLETGQFNPDTVGFRTLLQSPDGETEHADFVFQRIAGEWYWVFPSNMLDELPAELDERATTLKTAK